MSGSITERTGAQLLDVAQLGLSAAPDGKQRHRYRYVPKTYNSLTLRDRPHPTRAAWVQGLGGAWFRNIEDFRMYDGSQHSVRRSFQDQVSMQGSPNNFVDARLKAYKQNVAGQHLTQRANVILAARARVPGLNEDAWNDALNQRILGEMLDFTAALTSNEARPLPQPLPTTVRETPEQEHQRRLATMYSSRSGRLVPQTSRPSTRPATFSGNVNQLTGWKAAFTIDAVTDPVQRLAVELLCQLLQTDDLLIAASWISTASDTEKNLLFQLLRSAMDEQLKALDAAGSPSRSERLAATLPRPAATQPDRSRLQTTQRKLPTPPTPKPEAVLSLRRNVPAYDYSKDAYS